MQRNENLSPASPVTRKPSFGFQVAVKGKFASR